MSRLLPLTLDELLTTTRSVRKRLDLTRSVEREVIEECLAIALQAPTPSNMQNWHFLMVTDRDGVTLWTRSFIGRLGKGKVRQL